MAKLKKLLNLTRREKIIVVFFVLVIIILASSRVSSTPETDLSSANNSSDSAKGDNGSSNSQNAQSTSAKNTASKTASNQIQPAQPQPSQPAPRYYLVSTYGQGGRTYVIDSADATEDKLILVGKDLNKLFGSDDIARIGIYTDPSQAQIGAESAQATALQGDAAAAYYKAYVAQLNINKSTGLKQFTIMLNGQTKEIQL